MLYDNPTFHKGYLSYNKGKYDKALNYLDKALGENPEEVKSLCLKGVILHDYGHKENSDACFNMVIEIYNKYKDNPGSKVIEHMDEVAHEVGSSDDHFNHGIILYDLVLKLDNRNVKAYVEKAFNLDSLKRYDESIQCSDEAMKIDRYHRGVWNIRAMAFGNLGNFKEAIKCYDELLSFDPYYSMAWFSMAGITKKLGHLNDSELYLKISEDLGFIVHDEQVQPIAHKYYDFLELYQEIKMKEEMKFSEDRISIIEEGNYKRNIAEIERLMRTIKPRLTSHPIKNDLDYHTGIGQILNIFIKSPFNDFKIKSQPNNVPIIEQGNISRTSDLSQKFCTGCGNKLGENSNFCRNCGLAIKK